MSEYTQDAALDAKELTEDARKEWWLVPQAVLALAVVVAVVLVRELILR